VIHAHDALFERAQIAAHNARFQAFVQSCVKRRNQTAAGNPLAGIEYFTMLIDNDNSSTDYFMARADAYLKVNNISAAHHDLAQALDLNSSLPDAWCKMGITLQKNNKLEDACYHWRRALQMGSREAAEYIYRYCAK